MSLLDAPGDLARTPLAAVVLEARERRANGVLEIAHGGGTSRLWFRDGAPVGAQVFVGFRPLGHMLLQAGVIDIDALSLSLVRMAETRRPHGEILVEMGAASRVQVERALEEQQAGYVAQLAALAAGPFAFEASVEVPEWTRAGLLSPLRVLADALSAPAAADLVGVTLRPLAEGAVRLVGAYAESEPELARGLGATERMLVARLAAPLSLDAFLGAAGVPRDRAMALLAALLLLELAVPATSAGARETIDLAAGGAPEHGAAGSEPAPRDGEGGARAGVERRTDSGEARARRQRLLLRAMRNMGVGPFGARPPGAGPAVTATAGGGPAAAAGSSGAPGDAALREALLAVAPRAREKDLFARLGLADGAGREEVKRAFLALARQFHPDRFVSPETADLADTVRELFIAVNEAYEVLSDDRKRAAWLAERSGAATGRTAVARADFEKGEACLRTRDLPRARAFYEAAVRVDPRPEYQAALAFACLSDPRARDRDRARRLLAEATRDPACDRALYVAGLLARDDGDDDAAERLLRAAVAVNPRHVDAVRELRAIDSRRSARRG
ncbi:DUF4388 domain-containing protein [Anaeromyxobacter sp. Fw109-5]|uniref:DUF4388 domain-containing protein n=1 Tax=Anaeromyxobacter sp. (strain Fw109-5) TaxID=404589 RepID=UPI0000ED6CED|nr:DUF4388 domain-containing protein [Anaeromyxobacter sp. Fw109-5]ABS27994.1 heat shock protein DnaJ domain protein [Anaeromyxobacter sp. Fw109-5]